MRSLTHLPNGDLRSIVDPSTLKRSELVVGFEGLGVPPSLIQEPFGNVPPPNFLRARAYQPYSADRNWLWGSGWEMVDEVPCAYAAQRFEAIRDVVPSSNSSFR